MTLLHTLLACGSLPSEVESGSVDPACLSRADAVDAQRLRQAVVELATAPRRSQARRAEIRGWLRAALEPIGFVVEERPFTISGISGTNVVATGPGLTPRVLIGAHYDTVDGSPGADDNASGVAVVLEAARVMGPSAPVAFVFFDAEEPFPATVGTDGRNFAFGSQAFVDATPSWDFALILDAVGYTCDGCQKLPPGMPPGIVPKDGRSLALVSSDPAGPAAVATAAYRSAASGRLVLSLSMPGRGLSMPTSRFSDHAPFWDAGVPALFVTDTAILRNPSYHRATDTPDAIDPTLLADAARGAVATLAAVTGTCN